MRSCKYDRVIETSLVVVLIATKINVYFFFKTLGDIYKYFDQSFFLHTVPCSIVIGDCEADNVSVIRILF